MFRVDFVKPNTALSAVPTPAAQHAPSSSFLAWPGKAGHASIRQTALEPHVPCFFYAVLQGNWQVALLSAPRRALRAPRRRGKGLGKKQQVLASLALAGIEAGGSQRWEEPCSERGKDGRQEGERAPRSGPQGAPPAAGKLGACVPVTTCDPPVPPPHYAEGTARATWGGPTHTAHSASDNSGSRTWAPGGAS